MPTDRWTFPLSIAFLALLYLLCWTMGARAEAKRKPLDSKVDYTVQHQAGPDQPSHTFQLRTLELTVPLQRNPQVQLAMPASQIVRILSLKRGRK